MAFGRLGSNSGSGIFSSDIAPSNKNIPWLDVSVTPAVLKYFNNTSNQWEATGSASTSPNSDSISVDLGGTSTSLQNAIAQIHETLNDVGSTSTTYDKGNFTVTYAINNSPEKTITETYSGDVNRVRVITYVTSGIATGKIKQEAITESGKTTTTVYSYDSYGNMSGKTTTTV